jgi:hypothetical protein
MSAADDIKRLAATMEHSYAARDITTGHLYRGIALNDWRRARRNLHAAIDAIQSQRDALLDASQQALELLEADGWQGGVVEILRAAIKASEGKAA